MSVGLCVVGWGLRVVGRRGFALPLEVMTALFTLFLFTDKLFTRSVAIGNCIRSTDNSPIVNTAVDVSNGTINIASCSNGFAVGTPRNRRLSISCIKFSARAITTSPIISIAVSSGAHRLSRIIIVNCNHTGGASLANSIATVGPSSVGGNLGADTRSVLVNGITNIDIVDDSNTPNNTTAVHVHNNSSLGTDGSPLVIVSNLTVSGCNIRNLTGPLSLIGPGSVRDFAMLGSTDTATVCNSHTSGNIVVVAAGGNHGNSGTRISCDNGISIDIMHSGLGIVDNNRGNRCIGFVHGTFKCTGSSR